MLTCVWLCLTMKAVLHRGCVIEADGGLVVSDDLMFCGAVGRSHLTPCRLWQTLLDTGKCVLRVAVQPADCPHQDPGAASYTALRMHDLLLAFLLPDHGGLFVCMQSMVMISSNF